MKKIFLILFFFTCTFSAFAQEGKDSIAKKGKKFNVGVFISGGVNSTQYQNDLFIKYLFDETGSSKPAFVANYYSVDSGSAVPNKFVYSQPSLRSIMSVGLELNFNKFQKLKLHHILEASYMKFTGNYSYSVYYRESANVLSWTYINDNVQAKYSQTVFSLVYKLQPTYKFMFMSLGINYSTNIVKVNLQKKEQRDGWWFDEMTGMIIHSSSSNSSINTTNNIRFVNFPFQLGGGGYIKMKKVVLKPAFYFTPCFRKGYNFYAVSLSIGYDFKNA